MKRVIILSALFVATGTMFSWSNVNQIKPATSTSTTANTTVAAIKLAEAKASLSKANTKNVKTTLGTADGGI